MKVLALGARLRATIDIDACTVCRAFWFDSHENLQISPGSTLRLFTFIGEQSATPKTVFADVLRCPRCASRLILTHDVQRNTHFQYWRCDNEHGRFISFFDFLREKDFIRPLSPSQIEELRQNVQAVNCSNCGAPIDLTTSSVCGHCGSPLSMLDMKHAEQMVDQLQRASQPRPVDPAVPLNLAKARREVESTFASFTRDSYSWTDASSLGLVEAGLNAVARWLKKT
jgi:DNA-directed RNA polymerase subunit RPC12/RpoP